MPDYNGRFPAVSFQPMMGELAANTLGFSTVFSGNTPLSYFLGSVDRLNQFMTQRGGGIAQNSVPFQGQWPPASIGQSCTDQNGRRVPCPSESGDTPRQQTPGADVYVPTLPPGYDPSNEPGDFSRTPDGIKNPDGKTAGSKCGTFDLKCQVGEVFTEDAKKRLLLFTVAIIIIAAAIFSLR